jgi:hypothetical protein
VTAPLSFHASILPFIEQQALWKALDKSVGWDAPKNRIFYEKRLPAFLSPMIDDDTGPNGYAPAQYVSNSRLTRGGKGVSFAGVTDGLSNTILDGLTNAAFPAWGDPQNGRDPANGFGGGPVALGGAEGGALIGLMDGSVRFVSENTAPEVAKALATPAGGEELYDF